MLNALDDIMDVSGPDFKLAKPVEEPIKKKQSTLKSAYAKVKKNSAIIQKAAMTVTTDHEESEGLEFVDPEAEKRAKLAEAAKNRDDQPKMIVINGQLIPAASIGGAAKQAEKGPSTARNRFSLLNELKNKTLEKKSAKFNLEQLKETFQTTDLASKKKDVRTALDPLANELEQGIEEEDEDIFDQVDKPDEDYNPDDQIDDEAAAVCAAVWDEDENIHSQKEEEEGEEEQTEEKKNEAQSEDKSGKATPASVKSLAQKSNMSQKNDNDSSMDAFEVLKKR